MEKAPKMLASIVSDGSPDIYQFSLVLWFLNSTLIYINNIASFALKRQHVVLARYVTYMSSITCFKSLTFHSTIFRSGVVEKRKIYTLQYQLM